MSTSEIYEYPARTLADEIIDESEALATMNVLPNNATDAQVVNAISNVIGIILAMNSTGARLAIASYRRYDIRNLDFSVAA